MSHLRVKTKHEVQGPYGSTELRVLYAHHNNSSDVVQFFDHNGKFLFSVDDTTKNNLFDAINRLYTPQRRDGELNEGIEYMDSVDNIKCERG